ncbi:MAG: preprotein translocase subunit SecY [Deinococcales bacterium]
MLAAFRNALLIPDLRRKIFITLMLLGIYRLGVFIPTPGIDLNRLQAQLDNFRQSGAGGIFDVLGFITGGNFEVFSIFALGVIPYITASIIIQILTTVYPPLEKLSKEGEEGRRRINQYTRFGSIGLGAVQGLFLAIALLGPNDVLKVGWSNGPFFWFVVMVTQVAGVAMVMWLGEKITEFGVGNGISLIIFAGIVAGYPAAIAQQIQLIGSGQSNLLGFLFFFIMLIVALMGMVLITQAERRIPVQYARQQRGNRMVGGQTTYVPLRLNAAGVIPVIFATSVLILPSTLIAAFPTVLWVQRLGAWFNPGQWQGLILSTILVVAFTYFYTQITFDPRRIADNLREYGGFVPGVRPGQPTQEHLTKITVRITLWGALFLGFVNAAPLILSWLSGVGNMGLVFSGTGLLILVGVALDTLKQIESQLQMRHYEGFVTKGRIRGRGRRM